MKKTFLIMLLSASALLAQSVSETNRNTPEPAKTETNQDLSKQILELQAQLEATRARYDAQRKIYTSQHPSVVQLKTQLDDLERRLQRARADLQGPAAPLTPQRPLIPAARPPSAAVFYATPVPTSRASEPWWRNTSIIQRLELSPDQRSKVDQTIQQHRLRLIDLNAALEKEEVTLEPLVTAEPLDEGKITAQIDRVAQARAELEKANGRMLLSIRKVLTPEQWRTLNQLTPKTTIGK